MKEDLSIKFSEIWNHKKALYFLIMRDIMLRYRYTLIAIAWAILQPFVPMLVFTLVFHSYYRQSDSTLIYPIFAFTGLIFWNYFLSTVVKVSDSLKANKSFVTDIYIPRIILPLSGIFVGLVDFFFTFLFLLLLTFLFQVKLNFLGILMIFPSLILCALSAFGIGLTFAHLQIKYRDAKKLLSFITYILFFLSPIIYVQKSVLSHNFFFYANPLSGAIELSRSFLFNLPVNLNGVLFSFMISLALIIFGIIYFFMKEKEFADLL